MDINNYLNWEQVLVNEIAGSMNVFIILGLVVLLYIGAKMRFPSPVTIMVMAFFVLVMSSFQPSLLAILLVVVGGLFSFAINNIMNR